MPFANRYLVATALLALTSAVHLHDTRRLSEGIQRKAISFRKYAQFPQFPERQAVNATDDHVQRRRTIYRNCLPTEWSAVEGMMNILQSCESCLQAGAICPSGCKLQRFPHVEQAILCGAAGHCCMRLFGKSFLDLWAWDASTLGNETDSIDISSTSSGSESCGTPCAIRWGVDDTNSPVLAPCPLGEGTGFLVTNVTERLNLPVSCVSTAVLPLAMNSSLPWQTYEPCATSTEEPDLSPTEEPDMFPSNEPELSSTYEPEPENPGTSMFAEDQVTAPAPLEAPIMLTQDPRLPVAARDVAAGQGEITSIAKHSSVEGTIPSTTGQIMTKDGNTAVMPTLIPTNQTVVMPTQPIQMPTNQPILMPTNQPILMPTNQPMVMPTNQPMVMPTNQPVVMPTNQPMVMPTNQPMVMPTSQPIVMPTNQPMVMPTNQPLLWATEQPKASMTDKPVVSMTAEPDAFMTSEPEVSWTAEPEASMFPEPEAFITEEPEPSVTEEPEAYMTEEPEVSVTEQTETSPSAELEASVIAESRGRFSDRGDF
jgi:hypothetical protein